MTEIRVAMIGAGAIAEFHIAALREAEVKVTGVASSPDSKRAVDFGKRHEIDSVYRDVPALLTDSAKFDGVLVAIPIPPTLDVLRQVIATGLPTLVEKPVAYRSADITDLVETSAPVIVGYNRRFYEPVIQARREAMRDAKLIAHLVLPDNVSPTGGKAGETDYLTPFFANSVHGLDLARYVLGDLKVHNVSRIFDPNGGMTGLAAMLTAESGAPLQFSANWGAPANFSLTLDWPGRRYDLRPFEEATLYEGMEVLDPTPETPVRRYVPREVGTVKLDYVDYRLKPGFTAQASAFVRLMRGEDPAPAARLSDAHAILKLAEELVGLELGPQA